MSTTTSGAASLDPVQEAASKLGRHWGALLTYGIVTVVFGIMMLAWPQATLMVAIVLFALQLIVSGIFFIVQAIAADEASGGQRAMFGVLGAFSLLVALLCFRHPMQTLGVIALIVGAWWVASGVVDIIAAFGAQTSSRGWRAVMGVVSVVAGVFVILNPSISLVTLVWLLGIWFVVYGLLAVAASFALRSAAKTAAA